VVLTTLLTPLLLRWQLTRDERALPKTESADPMLHS
jgi:hypothetical protein